MKDVIRISALKSGKNEIFFEDFKLDESFKPSFPIASLDKIDVDIIARKMTDDFISIVLKVNAKVTLISSYSLKEFPFEIRGKEEINLTTNPDYSDSDEYTLFVKDEYEIDEDIYSLISSNVPLKPTLPGEKAPKSSNSYRILSEDEYEKEKKERGNPYFDKLDELFDDEDEK